MRVLQDIKWVQPQAADGAIALGATAEEFKVALTECASALHQSSGKISGVADAIEVDNKLLTRPVHVSPTSWHQQRHLPCC